MDSFRVILFFLLSIPLVVFSFRSLKNPHHHGFYRFFAFEGILILILLNAPYWMGNLLEPLQLFSGVLLLISVLLVSMGLFQLKTMGGKRNTITDPENHDFENTKYLVLEGIFKYIRHPMYSSLLFLTWGAFLKQITLLGFIAALLTTFFIYMTGKSEEKENILFFGDDYKNHINETKMFIPFVF